MAARDEGATLAPQLLEKDLVLVLSVRLRSALNARGFRVLTTREGDTDPSFDAEGFGGKSRPFGRLPHSACDGERVRGAFVYQLAERSASGG